MSLLLACSFLAGPVRAQSLKGLSLVQAIALLEREGLSVVYSTDLVKPWMKVGVEPVATEPVEMLDEMLVPFGLAVRSAPGGILLIVRASRDPGAALTLASRRDPRPAVSEAIAANVIVTARPYQLTRGIAGWPEALSATDIENLPDLGDDALRAVARLPGMTSNGLSAQTHIRGGDTSEALVRFDGQRLYNPFHLKDFQSIFSAIDPGLISSIDVYTGALPADAGDRMSGLIDITSLAPPGPRYREMSLSFFNASALGAGELADGKVTWLAAGRRSNLDVWYHAISKLPGTPTYADGFGKISYALSDTTRITANALYISDDVTLADEDGDEKAVAEFADSYAWLRLDQAIGASLRGSTWLSHTRLASHRSGTSVQTGVSVGSLDDHRQFDIDELRSEWSWVGGADWALQFGGEFARTVGTYDYRDETEFALLFDTPGASSEASRTRALRVEPSGHRSGLYANLHYRVAQAFSADVGLRWDRQSLDPKGSEPWSPRVGLRYRFSPQTDLRASWSRAYQSQNVDELLVSDGDASFAAPERTDQAAVGFEHRFANGLRIRAEAYDKRIAHPQPHYENLLNTLTLLPELKPDRILVAPERARARGFEVYLERGDTGRLDWWVGYSRSTVRDEVDGVEFPRSWDQRDAVSAGLDWTHRPWNVAIAAIYRSGWPTTSVELDPASATPRALVGRRNTRQLSYFASADLKISRRFDFNHSSLTAFFEVSNFLGRANPCCTAYEIDDETAALELERRDYLPVIPSLGVLWQF